MQAGKFIDEKVHSRDMRVGDREREGERQLHALGVGFLSCTDSC